MTFDGFTRDELLAIGTRKHKTTLPISASDINRSLPFNVSMALAQEMDGFTEEQLKMIGEGKAPSLPIQPSDIGAPRVSGEAAQSITGVMDKLQKFLGIRLS